MGFLDSVQDSLNRAGAGANRSVSTMKLRAQLSDALKRRQNLAAQLGASLYEATKDDPELRRGREALYDGIAAVDAERAGYQAEIDRIEAEAQASARLACPFCGSAVNASDLFCAGCGKPMGEIQSALAAQQTPATVPAPAAGAATCPSCGSPIAADDAFCMNCGCKIEAAVAADPAPKAAPAPADGPATGADSQPGQTPVADPAPADGAASTVAPADGSERRSCPGCGHLNNYTSKFCMQCGAPLL